MDKLDFLSGSDAVTPSVAEIPAEAPAATPAPEPTAQPAEASDGRQRGPDGKFVSKAETAPAAEAAPATPAPTPEAGQPAAEAARAPDGFVPVAALQAIRDELNALKRQPPQQQQPPQPQLQPGDDGYEDWQAQKSYDDTIAAKARVEIARTYAVKEHGEELVGQAQTWAAERFNLDPMFRQQAMSASDPIAFAIGEFQHHQALQMLRDPKVLQQFMAMSANGQAPAQSAPATPPAAPPAATPPPASITSAPSAGGSQHIPTGDGTAYGALFSK